MYEKANIKGVGYKNVEVIISTQHGFNGAKLVEKESGSGNVILQKMELEAERQLTYPMFLNDWECDYPTGEPQMDYINFTKEAEFEYMPVSYQTGTYDQKWIEKLCVQNYRIGAVLTEMYTHAEHLQKKTEVKTRLYGFCPECESDTPHDGHVLETACCTGVLEANLNAQVIGVAHIGWMSRDPEPSALVKGRHIEYGRSVEDLTGVFSIEKFIQLWGNSTCGAISVDWLPCL
ncbi:MAG TPA: hypothetical protein PLI05_01780 [Methanotrichaceae archaeon]|nr:hypothetical protein [Methanotrichaceae archaeon]HQF15782.1 hypothetical protein [Methanotrichaceae archaeon]